MTKIKTPEIISERVKTIQQNTRTADGIWFVVQGEDENGEYRELAISQFDNCPCCDSLDSVGVVNSSYDDVMFSVRCYRCDLQIDGDTIAEAIERWNNAERLRADALNRTADLEAKLAMAREALKKSKAAFGMLATTLPAKKGGNASVTMIEEIDKALATILGDTKGDDDGE